MESALEQHRARGDVDEDTLALFPSAAVQRFAHKLVLFSPERGVGREGAVDVVLSHVDIIQELHFEFELFGR